jgi:hypothetical protein
MKVDIINWQMLKNPFEDDNNKNNVQINPLVDGTKRKIVQ